MALPFIHESSIVYFAVNSQTPANIKTADTPFTIQPPLLYLAKKD
jgi:hypothetical protein